MAERERHDGKGSKIGRFVASIVELFDREIKVIDEEKVYKNDSDNLYPNRIELIERNSVTAFASAQKLKAFITGKGFVNSNLNEMVVNKPKGINGHRFLILLANSIKTHRGAFIHVNYDIEGNVNYLDVLDYKKCRISKEDDNDFPGKIYYRDWRKKKAKFGKNEDSKERWFYPYNRNEAVITDQRINDLKLREGGEETVEALVKNYRGQVYFLNLDDTETYPYAWIHPAYNDADNEYRIGLYRNSNLRSGFLNKTMIIPNGIDPESMETFDSVVKEWLGAENSSSVFVMKPMDTVAENIDNVIKTIELKGTYDSKRFENDEKSIENNIRKCYLSIPKILISPEDSFFGSSGEAFREAVNYYNNETLFLRDTVAYMMEQFYPGNDFTIEPLSNNQPMRENGV